MFNRLKRSVRERFTGSLEESGAAVGVSTPNSINNSGGLKVLPELIRVLPSLEEVTSVMPQAVAVGLGCTLRGNTWFLDPTSILGNLFGVITSTSEVHVARGATLNGKIMVKRLVVLGEVEGDITAESIDVRSGGVLRGKAKARSCKIASLARIEAALIVTS